MNIDLHCHSTASDGVLTPPELLELAVEREVDMLSITDHDTLAAYHHEEIQTTQINLITGIELTALWRNLEIHVVGLNLDLHHESILVGVDLQTKTRKERATRIAQKLESVGIQRGLDGANLEANGGQIGRLHFARYLVKVGAAKDVPKAFKKFLGRGKMGDVKTSWPNIESVVSWITRAGGIAVLAHPAKYGLTKTKINSLLGHFKNVGGQAMEVISGMQSPELTRELALLSGNYQLLASCGSDFHTPEKAWAALGRVESLPAECIPVWEHW